MRVPRDDRGRRPGDEIGERGRERRRGGGGRIGHGIAPIGLPQSGNFARVAELPEWAVRRVPGVDKDYFSAPAAGRIGAQRAISERTKRSKAAGRRSALVGIEPPSLVRVSRTVASSSALSSASASFAISSGGVPLGANSPAQTLMS